MNNAYFLKTKDNLESLVKKYLPEGDHSLENGDAEQALENFKNHKLC
jgi:hypothetical protein